MRRISARAMEYVIRQERQYFFQVLISSSVIKTAMAPLENAKLLLQTQDSNPRVISGEIARYTGTMDCFRRVLAEQGVLAFWSGNFVNCIRYVPQQMSALMFNDMIKRAVPKYNPRTDYWKDFATKLLAGVLADGLANVVCCPFDFARTRVATDLVGGVGPGAVQCVFLTLWTGGLTGLYRGAGVTVLGAFVYRGGQLAIFAQMQDLNPWKYDKGSRGASSQLSRLDPNRRVSKMHEKTF